MSFRKTALSALKVNPFDLMEHDWFLLTAGTKASFNTMTCGWGALGTLWNRPIALVFVRPTRHTYGFMNRADRFTLSFFPEKNRPALKFCGSHSGRDCDKVQQAGLTPVFSKTGFIYFREARMVLECRKLYFDDLKPNRFLEKAIERNYPGKDYHRFFVGEILNIWQSFRKSGG
jgi:flavin reductase (DIM6/NTAB) family NADH-FMN oxidoreductase RutF